MIYEIRHEYLFFSDASFAQLAPCLVQPWQAEAVKRTRYWWRVRLEAWLARLRVLGAADGQRRIRVRVIDERT